MQRSAQDRPTKKSPRPLKKARIDPASQVVSMDVVVPKKKKRSNAAIAIEKKFLDNSIAATALTAPTDFTGGEVDPATTLCLTAPAQGDGASNREGKQIIGKSLQIKGQVFALGNEAQTSPPLSVQCIVACVLDTQTNNAQMNSEDLWTNVQASAALNACPLRNMNFGKRFKVLKQEVFNLENTALSHFAVDSFTKSSRSAIFDWFIPLNDLRINFNTTATGVIGNVLDNSIHMIAFTNTTSEVTPTLIYNSRFRFVG